MEQYYIKKGRRYKPVEPFVGFPTDGIWIVRDAGRKSQIIMWLGSEVVMSDDVIQMASDVGKLNDIICKGLIKYTNKPYTYAELSKAIARDIVSALKEQS